MMGEMMKFLPIITYLSDFALLWILLYFDLFDFYEVYKICYTFLTVQQNRIQRDNIYENIIHKDITT